jgi:hypothetical protein
VQASKKLQEIKNLTFELELMRDYYDRKSKSTTQETITKPVQKRTRRKREELDTTF